MKSFQKFLVCSLFFILAGTGLAQNAAPYVTAGNQLLAAKDYARAAQYYDAATKMDPNSAAAFQGLGNCKYYQGDKAGALAAYEKALAIDPSNASLSSFVQTLRTQVGAPQPGFPAAATTTSPSYAASPKPMAKKSSFEVDVMAGGAIGLSQGYGFGFGGSASGRLPMGTGMKIGAELGFHTFGSSTATPFGNISSSVGSLSILGSGKLTLGMTGMKPYLLAGLGVTMLMQSITYPSGYPISSYSYSDIYPTIQIGGGMAFPAGPDMDFFAEVKANVVIGSDGTFTYIPIGGGLAFNL